MLTDRQTNRRNYTNFEKNLAMIVIYLPVKFEFDWTNHFQLRVRKRKFLTDFELESGNGNGDGRTNERVELHQFRKEPSYDGDLSPCQV